ncbi:putative DNA mismatch repair protein Mlh3-like [Apostichopus japonicus]|uniref:Putative DNA mismatch repair protein Mlh3-like n=1 Tax=Stichopus japonicus TaxID=307972 RepID=A0A2G8KYI7_STIJA|nr:putative DNA mismatch repair protein Mlh3-like [Apostichopus japonicus]
MLKKAKQPIATDLAETLVQECIQLIQDTAGSCGVLPKTIVKALNSQACRGAIKFGDVLNMEDMVCLLSQLSECKLPFQCAHGRPSIIPLLDLDHLVEKLTPQVSTKPNLTNFSLKMSQSNLP